MNNNINIPFSSFHLKWHQSRHRMQQQQQLHNWHDRFWNVELRFQFPKNTNTHSLTRFSCKNKEQSVCSKQIAEQQSDKIIQFGHSTDANKNLTALINLFSAIRPIYFAYALFFCNSTQNMISWKFQFLFGITLCSSRIFVFFFSTAPKMVGLGRSRWYSRMLVRKYRRIKAQNLFLLPLFSNKKKFHSARRSPLDSELIVE